MAGPRGGSRDPARVSRRKGLGGPIGPWVCRGGDDRGLPTQPTGPSAPPTQPTGPSAPPTQPTGPSAPPTQPTGPSAPPTQPTGPSAPPTQPTGPSVPHTASFAERMRAANVC